MTVKYTREHEWIRIEGDTATVGVTFYAQEQLGDVVFVELPDADTSADQGTEVAVVESVKAASDIYAPVTGTIVESNAELSNRPELVNEDPENDGWFFKIKITDTSELEDLLDEADYQAFIQEEL
ncbi:MAG: glycine cleavage system protein H [Gammaproteobacteria bacterium]|nr:glycine cleavage system protein H [Gammaproteobacteria bacterium]|tara:strand:- start:4966 stop:5340 length:375 start_codon:yes stop_codon:yes gene_type:complete